MITGKFVCRCSIPVSPNPLKTEAGQVLFHTLITPYKKTGGKCSVTLGIKARREPRPILILDRLRDIKKLLFLHTDPVDQRSLKQIYSHVTRQCHGNSKLGNLVAQTSHGRLFCAAASAHHANFCSASAFAGYIFKVT